MHWEVHSTILPLVKNVLPRDTIRITKYRDQVRIDFSNILRIMNPGQVTPQTKNPMGKDFTLLVRNGSKYRSHPSYQDDQCEPSVVLLDWNRGEFVDLLDPAMQMDEHVLMIRRLMTHKKIITNYVKES